MFPKSATGLIVLFSFMFCAYLSYVQFVKMIFAIPVVEEAITSEIVMVGPADCGGCIHVITFDPQIANPIGISQRFKELQITVLEVVPVLGNEVPVANRDRWDIRVLFHNTSMQNTNSVSTVGDQVQDNNRFWETGKVAEDSPLANGIVHLAPNESIEVVYTYWIKRDLDELYWLYAMDLGIDEEGRVYANDLVVFKLDIE